MVRTVPALVNETDPARREAVLVTLTARVALIAQFERTEASIYASQLELLNYLNARPTGESVDRLRELFYAPAVARFPDTYRGYPLDGYLGFLQGSGLVTITDLRVSISPAGRDYLVWRIEQQKPPRVHG
jgi:hypothetical protein